MRTKHIYARGNKSITATTTTKMRSYAHIHWRKFKDLVCLTVLMQAKMFCVTCLHRQSQKHHIKMPQHTHTIQHQNHFLCLSALIPILSVGRKMQKERKNVWHMNNEKKKNRSARAHPKSERMKKNQIRR